jgi:alanine dehydrogenase
LRIWGFDDAAVRVALLEEFMPIRFRLLTESDVKAVLTMDDLVESMASALRQFSAGRVVQPVRTVIPVSGHAAFFATMPAFSREPATLGAKLVTVVGSNLARGLPSHLATIVLLDPETGAMVALLDGSYITAARTAAVSAVSSRLLARTDAGALAIIGSGVQARSHLDALARVHALRRIAVWSPTPGHRQEFARTARAPCAVRAVEHPREAVEGADLIVLATSSPTPVIEDTWVEPGAHVASVGACRPTQREMDPALVKRGRLFVDSRAAALVEAGDIVKGIEERLFGPEHIVAELGELVNGALGRASRAEVTIFKSLGLAVEDLVAADLALRRATERGIGTELTL